jgi:hypothetical protein
MKAQMWSAPMFPRIAQGQFLGLFNGDSPGWSGTRGDYPIENVKPYLIATPKIPQKLIFKWPSSIISIITQEAYCHAKVKRCAQQPVKFKEMKW